MSHIVIHDDRNRFTHYTEFDGLADAVRFLEDLINTEGESNARLFALEPVEFAVKTYARIEIADRESATARIDEANEAGKDDAGDGESGDVRPAPAGPEATKLGETAVEYVEIAVVRDETAEPFAPVDDVEERQEEAPAGDSRRGLFGR